MQNVVRNTANPTTPDTVRLITPPRLLVPWESWPKSFLRNLADQFRRQPPPIQLSSPPAPFWPDVFVTPKLPGRSFLISLLYHGALFAIIYASPALLLLMQKSQQESAARRTTLTYYKISEYLPPIPTAGAPAKIARPGEPAFARQEIISVPHAPSNHEQTVINPNSIKIASERALLPDLVVWTPLPATPAAAISQSTAKLILPAIPVQVIEPATAVPQAAAKLVLPMLPVEVIQPAPSIESDAKNISRLKLPAMPQPSVVAPTLDSVPGKLAALNLAQPAVELAEPKLPISAQSAANRDLQSASAKIVEAPPPPPAPVISGTTGANAAGKLIALGLRPADVQGPLVVPDGNSRGEFSAAPNGNPNASGTPEIKAASKDRNGKNSGTSNGMANRGRNGDQLPGISIGAGPANAQTTIQGVVASPAASPHPGNAEIHNSRRLLATVIPPRIPQPQENVPALSAPDAGETADAIFGAKKFYSLVLNMPNLASAGGSWVIRFAELSDRPSQGSLTAPVAVEKVDPAYPPDLVRDGVQGTVTLYAVIRSDGAVDEIKILRSLDVRLDESARRALSQWRFRPAQKNGAAVDLEAVIQIPFRSRKLPF